MIKDLPIYNPADGEVAVTTRGELADLVYDYSFVSAFFTRPLRIDIPHLKTQIEVGEGLGGFSANYFQRHFHCTACGKCCRGNFRQSWIWHFWESCPEKSPSGVSFVHETIGINDVPVEIRIYRNPRISKCEFLEDQPDGRGFCSLHFNGPTDPENGQSGDNWKLSQKNTLCRTFLDLFPQYRKETNVDGTIKDRLYFAKRLGSRNWQRPKCPAEWEPMTKGDQQYEWDRDLLGRYARLIEQVPGNLGWDIFAKSDQLYDLNRFYDLSHNSNLLTFETLLAAK